MSDAIISVENLGKCYRISHQGEKQRYTALRDVIASKVKGLFVNRKSKIENRKSDENFWALKDVSFEVKKGEVVGIIGRNGAGKSTLLKILSRITEPTTGRVHIKGRVASLLEVGTGFHPELTGRENIFLNGAILGMHRAEIKKKFDEIVAFAEVEKFLDTPVKRYSSGMYVRLAFAVAAHLEPEILIVDEVLAVGDAQFQKKCLGKMQDVSKGGRTVLFVSHDMGNVTKLCERGILLDQGKVEFQGEITSVITCYMRGNIMEQGYADLANRGDRTGSGDAQFQSVELINASTRRSTFAFGAPLTVRTTIKVKKTVGNAHMAILISTSDGIPVHGLESTNDGMVWPAETGRYQFNITIPKLHLVPGGYIIDLWVGDHQRSRVDYLKGAIAFQVVQTPESGLALPLDRNNGLVFTQSEWSHNRII